MGRAPCCDKANVKKGPWSPEEDATLKSYIEKNGTGGNWIALPQKVGLKRCGKSCRLRWLNYLRPNIKHGGFTEEEDNIICSLYISIGSRWSIIAAQLPGRTDNDIKNYWNTRLKKKLLGKRKQSNNNNNSLNQKDTNGNIEENSLSNSALERLQLHMQLQNPFSNFYPSLMWPKLHPSQEKMIQTLQALNHDHHDNNPNPIMQNSFMTSSYKPSNDVIQQDGAKINRNDPQVDILVEENIIPLNYNNNNNNNYSSMINSSLAPRGEAIEKRSNEGIQQLGAMQNELDDILNNRINTAMDYLQKEEDEFDCFREMNVSKESLIWWSNNSDTKSGSSNSWDSSNNHQVLMQDQGMFQDYVLGYSM